MYLYLCLNYNYIIVNILSELIDQLIIV